jgi:hypothetical protein
MSVKEQEYDELLRRRRCSGIMIGMGRGGMGMVRYAGLLDRANRGKTYEKRESASYDHEIRGVHGRFI